jgi:hypothetical protein
MFIVILRHDGVENVDGSIFAVHGAVLSLGSSVAKDLLEVLLLASDLVEFFNFVF